MDLWLTIAVAVLVICIMVSDTLPAIYRRRACAGRAWRRAFAGASAHEIREFLRLFTDAFVVDAKHPLKFTPDDKLSDIYKAFYPHAWQADAMEFEVLSAALEASYNLVLADLWHDQLTLGELFAKVQAAKR